MSSSTATSASRGASINPVDRHASYDKKKLFILSVIALVTAGLSFGIRSSIANDLQTTFFDPIDRLRSAEMIGSVLGVAFLGFAFTIAIGSPLLDYLGLGRLLGLSSFCFITGTCTVIFAHNLSHGAGLHNVPSLGLFPTPIASVLLPTVINPP